MQINEVLQPSEQALTEMVEANNDTGLLTEDVVKIIRSKDGPWSEPVSADESNARMKALLESHGIVYE